MAIPAGDSDAFLVEMVDAPPAHLLFKIESFSKLPKHHESMAFTAGDCKWKLSLSPKSSGGDRMYLSLSLAQFQAQFHAMPSGLQVNATCSIFLYNTTLDNYLCFRGNKRIFNIYNPRWGFSISKKMLLEPSNGFLVDDSCIFGAEVLSSTPVKSIQCSSSLEWEIPHSARSKGAWTSEEFLLGGLGWRMKISGGERVVICLEFRESYEKVEADVRIRLTKKPASAAFFASVASSHCFTSDKDVCAIACPKAFADVFKPGKDGCFLAAEITVKGVQLSSLFD